MLGWAIGFFIAASVAAVFGFGGFSSAFAGIAVVMFWGFLALFVLSLLFGKFGGAHAAGHGASGGLFAGLSLIAGMALVTYAWIDNDMSAERVGRSIDRGAVQLAEGASEAFSRAGERAETMTQDASQPVAPEEEKDDSPN